MFRSSVKGTGYPLHSPVSPSLPLPCVTVCHHIWTGVCKAQLLFVLGRRSWETCASFCVSWCVCVCVCLYVCVCGENQTGKNSWMVRAGEWMVVLDVIWCFEYIIVTYNSNVYLTAILLSPGGSGYFTCIQNVKLVTTEFKSGRLHEKHVVATWNVGNHLSISL